MTPSYGMLTMMMNSLSLLNPFSYDDNNTSVENTFIYNFPESRIEANKAVENDCFPNDFLFGAATSAYQIEGAWNYSDKSPSMWDQFTHDHPELILDHSNGDVAADSFHKYLEDIDLLEQLGANTYRFSLSWTRILPNAFDNKISATGVEFYNKLINELLRRGITPIVTIYHWDLPQKLQELGGWSNPLIVDWFVDYARVVFRLFGDRVKIWSTINEPLIFCSKEIIPDEPFAINKSGIADYLCGHYALLAHAKVYQLYDQRFRPKQRGKIGIVLSLTWPVADSNGLNKSGQDDVTTYFEFWNGWFLNPIFSEQGDYPSLMRERINKKSKEQGFSYSRLPVFSKEEIELIKGTSDYLGVNFYSATFIKPRIHNSTTPISYSDDIGAEPVPGRKQFKDLSTPWALELLLHKIHEKYNIPTIYITENGFSDQGQLKDIDRARYYHQHLSTILRVMHFGVDIRGYYAWSLLDNFEWTSGYTQSYGLYKVHFDDPNRRRVPKLSTKIISSIYKTRKIPRLAMMLVELVFDV